MAGFAHGEGTDRCYTDSESVSRLFAHEIVLLSVTTTYATGASAVERTSTYVGAGR